MITANPDEDPIEKREWRVSAVQPTKRLNTKGEIRTIKEFIGDETKDAYCPKATTQDGVSGSKSHGDYHQLFVHTSKINGCLQKVVLVSLRESILRTESYARIAGHPAERRMYDTMEKVLFCLHMANDAYLT